MNNTEAAMREAQPDWATVEVNQGFPALMEALHRAAQKGYMPDAMAAEWGAFDYRLPFATPPAAQPDGQVAQLVTELRHLYVMKSRVRAGEHNTFPLNAEQAQANIDDSFKTAIDQLAALASRPVVAQPVAVDRGLSEATDAMIAAYLMANDEYWRKADEVAPPIGRWRAGTSREATRVSLNAALAASAPSQAEPPKIDEPWAPGYSVRVVAPDADCIDLVFVSFMRHEFQMYPNEAKHLRDLLNHALPPTPAGSCQASGALAESAARMEAGIANLTNPDASDCDPELLAYAKETLAAPPAGRTLTDGVMLDLAECLRPVLKTPTDWGLALQYARAILAAASTTEGA